MNNKIKSLVLAGWFLDGRVLTAVIMQCRQNNTDVKSKSREAQERWYSVLRMHVMHVELQRKKTGNIKYKPVTEARLDYHSYHRKAISIIYSECGSVVLVIQNTKRKHHIVICGLSGSTIFFHIISLNSTMCGKILMNSKCVFWFSLQLLSETSHSKKNSARYYHKCTYLFM